MMPQQLLSENYKIIKDLEPLEKQEHALLHTLHVLRNSCVVLQCHT